MSDELDVLWLAISSESISPDVPTEFGSDAILFNDIALVKTGDIMPDGALVYDFNHWELSSNGQWAIVTARVDIGSDMGLVSAVYRFQIPTPGATSVALLACLAAARRRR